MKFELKETANLDSGVYEVIADDICQGYSYEGCYSIDIDKDEAYFQDIRAYAIEHNLDLMPCQIVSFSEKEVEEILDIIIRK